MAELRAYLEDVGQGLAREMPAARVAEILAETEAHLRERIAALEELGLATDMAEREAIHAFGGAESYVEEVVDAHRPSRRSLDRSMVRVALLASLVALIVFPGAFFVGSPGSWHWSFHCF
jgi:hypothetical protein